MANIPLTVGMHVKKLRDSKVDRFPPAFAKLYSHQTRLQAGYEGLKQWGPSEALDRLEDALRLIEVSRIEKEAAQEHWSVTLRRSAELLEWLSHPALNPECLPLRLIAAAAYQVAGYPARASGLFMQMGTDEPNSELLQSLLRGDFQRLLRQLGRTWAALADSSSVAWSDSDGLSEHVARTALKAVSSALGILCSHMRWGTEPRINNAISNLFNIADVFVNGEDPFSWILAELTAQTGDRYAQNALREELRIILERTPAEGTTAFERYVRLAYLSGKSIAWPSQARGIQLLSAGGSFALCTPTGSGKTVVAEIAILEGLFSGDSTTSENSMALYLVPSRALAAEVEAKLSFVLSRLGDKPIIVTGLYGGTDWGPTDAWLTTEDRVVLIATYEKAEALLRFLGPLFVSRVKTVIIDEAHSLQMGEDRSALFGSDCRSLRLESLGMRLLSYVPAPTRVIALSAVAGGIEGALGRWVSGAASNEAEALPYRSTRQLVGRLECYPDGGYRIEYDTLDGDDLRFAAEGEGSAAKPFIPNPFPKAPAAQKWASKGSEKRLRPQLFWAAIHLASQDAGGKRKAVLVSLTQHVGGYAEDLLGLLNQEWKDSQLPLFFNEPTDPEGSELLKRALDACEDYLGRTSCEYRLLQKGIVVHHGKMPGSLARFLVELIQKRVVNLVIATSTLSEGVNLPFETILIPTLRRMRSTIDAKEFGNLIGRAGRPGFGTEGRSLVLVEPEPAPTRQDPRSQEIRDHRNEYSRLVRQISDSRGQPSGAASPLAELIRLLGRLWSRLYGSSDHEAFFRWLETTSTDDRHEAAAQDTMALLDNLDGILVAGLTELETIERKSLSRGELEAELQRVWRRSYAHFADAAEARLENVFVRRGIAIQQSIYPHAGERRKLYRTGLPPRSGRRLIEVYSEIEPDLARATDYATWDSVNRFAWIEQIVGAVLKVPAFTPAPPRRKIPWSDVLRWWLDPRGAKNLPGASKSSYWYSYVNRFFQYRANWGLGGIIGLAFDRVQGPETRALSLEEWPSTGLPWAVFWLKELITWGTLEPVTAYLLSRGLVSTRSEGTSYVGSYYTSQASSASPNELLDPRSLRDWASVSIPIDSTRPHRRRPPAKLRVEVRDCIRRLSLNKWRVLPVSSGSRLDWYDLSGFLMASSDRPSEWDDGYADSYDFIMDISEGAIGSGPY